MVDGVLVIEARKEASGRLTSARLKTHGTFAVQPGVRFKTIKVEARIFLPQGAWAHGAAMAALGNPLVLWTAGGVQCVLRPYSGGNLKGDG